ncbi:MAG: type VI secretion system-associated FHA domain protein TagH [bacterium]
MSVSLRFQSSGAVPGDGRPVVMRGPSLTIGRGPENDLVLPDPDRQISKTHCVIENHNGNLVAVDLSTNGTFLNYGKIALGRTPTPLNDGDVLVMGPYELVVNVASQSSEPMAPMGDERASFGNAAAAPDPMRLLDDAGPGGDFLDSLLGSDKPKGPGQFRGKQDEFVELLPPLGEEDPLGPAPSEQGGPAMQDHGPSGSDAYRVPSASRSVIPDDWEDLMAPTPHKAPPAAHVPPPPAASVHIPDDDIFGTEPLMPAMEPTVTPDANSPVPEAGPEIPAASVVEPAITPPPASPKPAPPAEPAAALSQPPAPSVPGFDPFATAAVSFDPFATDPNRPTKSTSVPAHSAMVEPVAVPVAAQPAAVPAASVAAPVAPAAPAQISAGGSDAARGFLAALGAEELRITDAELPDTMLRLGRTLKSMITGLREILMTRTSIKSEFRIEQTMVNVGGNNPLKFSISPEQAVEAMVKPTVRGYLPAEKAAEQALEDIKAHEVAMVTGMEAALKGVLGKLDPALLTKKIEAKGGFGGFMKNRKAQYWETYEAMYAEISDQAENDFHELFAREFAKAYKDQLARLKAESQG